jgi:hypothetical protein
MRPSSGQGLAKVLGVSEVLSELRRSLRRGRGLVGTRRVGHAPLLAGPQPAGAVVLDGPHPPRQPRRGVQRRGRRQHGVRPQEPPPPSLHSQRSPVSGSRAFCPAVSDAGKRDRSGSSSLNSATRDSPYPMRAEATQRQPVL